MEGLPVLAFGRETTGLLDAALRREWLLTDGTGSYAMGTVAGARTRRYHGLLVAALDPPRRRVMVVGGAGETARVDGHPEHGLHAQHWASGAVDPHGHELCEEFRLEGGLPVWRFRLEAGVLLERRLWMPRGSRSTRLRHRVLEAPAGTFVTVRLHPLLAWRDHHGVAVAGDSLPEAAAEDGALLVRWPAGACSITPSAPAEVEPGGVWYRGYLLDEEWERGLEAVEDLFGAGVVTHRLRGGEAAETTFAVLEGAGYDGAGRDVSLRAEEERRLGVLARSGAGGEPDWIRQLVLAADDFIAVRGDTASVVAGYPWLAERGRDTMVALGGLALETGRPELSAQTLRAWGERLAPGAAPAPAASDPPGRETSAAPLAGDAALWFVEALRAHGAATGDGALVEELRPVLEALLAAVLDGAWPDIALDPSDGLLHVDGSAQPATWMDARAEGRLVTPRRGKPVEVNALWYSALVTLAGWSEGRPGPPLAAMADRVRSSFDRYWDPARRQLRDVLDGAEADEATLRPNQLIAAALPQSPVDDARAAAVLDRCMRELRTSLGVRTLGPDEPFYTPRCTGGERERQTAYHQGTAWPWLLGPLVRLHLRVHGDPGAARALLLPLAHHLSDAGLGGISEILDGDPPHTPRGCPWQAWSVAEVLAAWGECRRAEVGAAAPVAQPA